MYIKTYPPTPEQESKALEEIRVIMNKSVKQSGMIVSPTTAVTHGPSSFQHQLSELLDRPGMDKRLAESIFSAREGHWNFEKWNSDPRIKEAYIKDAQAVIKAIKEAANV